MLASTTAVRNQIEQLDQQIADHRAQLGLATPTGDELVAASTLSADTIAMTCQRATSDTCADVCSLGDSICENADKICDLASQLPGDRWAGERCDAGKATCKVASERCCAC
jgi:hypothetical protein